MSTLSIGVTGLNAAMIGLTTTSHNIANQATAGYNRQVIVQEANLPVHTGAGFIGQGTNVETVKRIYDQYLSQQVLSAQTSASAMDSYYQQISQIDGVLADATSGLSSAMTAFFNGVQTVAANPSSISARQSMTASAEALTARFQSLDQRLAEIRDGVNSQITDQVAQVSTYASQIAQMNQQIVVAQSGDPSQPANDLLDKRDQLIADLNKITRVSTIQQGDGTLSVFFGNGQPLVVGSENYTLSTEQAADDPESLVVVIKTQGGTTLQVPESQITGGTLGGLISFRSESLDSAQNALGRVAIAMTQTFNAQHRLGQDLTGALGGDFFSVNAPTAYASSLNTSTAVLTGSYTATAAGDLTTSDYVLSYDGTDYTLTRLSDNQTWTNANLATLTANAAQGFDLTLSTTPNAGDTFKIEPTRAGASSIDVVVGDPRNIAAAAPMSTAASLANTGTGKISAGSVTSVTYLPIAASQSYTLTYDATNNRFTVSVPDVGNPPAPAPAVANIPYDPASQSSVAISFNGLSFTISGTPADGDTFTVSPNSSGVSDNRNAVALAALQTAKTMISGGTANTASFQDAYAQLVSAVGTKAAQVKSVGDAQQALVDSATATQQSMSGVNLDEEAANLLKYQQAYQASAKVIDISAKLFDTLLSLGQ